MDEETIPNEELENLSNLVLNRLEKKVKKIKFENRVSKFQINELDQFFYSFVKFLFDISPEITTIQRSSNYFKKYDLIKEMTSIFYFLFILILLEKNFNLETKKIFRTIYLNLFYGKRGENPEEEVLKYIQNSISINIDEIFNILESRCLKRIRETNNKGCPFSESENRKEWINKVYQFFKRELLPVFLNYFGSFETDNKLLLFYSGKILKSSL